MLVRAPASLAARQCSAVCPQFVLLCGSAGRAGWRIDAQRLRGGCLDVPGVYTLAARAKLPTNNCYKVRCWHKWTANKPTRTTSPHGRKCTQYSKENEVRDCSEALRRLASPGYGLAGRAAASTILLYVEELPRYAIDAGDPREEHRRHHLVLKVRREVVVPRRADGRVDELRRLVGVHRVGTLRVQRHGVHVHVVVPL